METGARHGAGATKSGIYFLWERHTEASTVTLIFPYNCPDKIYAPYIQWLEQWTGSVVRAVRIFVVPKVSEIKSHLTAQEIDDQEMVCCDINSGLRIWSDFGVHKDGYGRLLVSAGDASDDERGRINQRGWSLLVRRSAFGSMRLRPMPKSQRIVCMR